MARTLVSNRATVVLTLLVCLWLGATTSVCYSVENPLEDITTTLNWRKDGNNRSEALIVGDYYVNLPGYTGWCGGHMTSQDSKFTHYHVTSDFPYWSTVWEYTVTEAMVEAYWDWYYITERDYTQTGALDQAYNCHGYTFGRTDCWVECIWHGVAVIITDEYDGTYGMDATHWLEMGLGHSAKILSMIRGEDMLEYIEEKSEKNRDSGIYEKTGSAPCYLGSLVYGEGYKVKE